MKAWMPGEATYTPFRIELAIATQDSFRQWRETLLEYAIRELGGAPDEWRWELDGDVVVLTAARATC